MHPTATKLLFSPVLLIPEFFRFFRLVPDASDRYKIVPLPVPLISGFFRLFPDELGLFPTSRMRPAVTKLFPFLFLSLPDFSAFFRRLVPDASDPPRNCSHSCCSKFFRIFRSCPTCSGCVPPSQNCSPSCSSHFRISLDFSDFFQIFRLSGCFALFRLVPDASRRHEIVPLPVPLISGFFRIFPPFSVWFRLVPVGSAVTKLFSLLFLSFPNFSDLFRMRPAVTKWLPFLFLSFPDFSRFFRLLPDFSDLFRMRSAVTKLFPFLFLSFADFSDFCHASRPQN